MIFAIRDLFMNNSVYKWFWFGTQENGGDSQFNLK